MHKWRRFDEIKIIRSNCNGKYIFITKYTLVIYVRANRSLLQAFNIDN